MNNNYVDLYLPNHHRARKNSGNVHEHIIIAEKKLNRKLTKNEVVHHQDENKSNNSPENLFVFKSKSDHSRYHMTNIMIKEKDYWVSPPQKGSPENPYIKKCKVCNKKFESIEQTSNYCGHICSNFASRRAVRPSKEELYNLLKTNPFTSVGKMFNVSDNAIRKWCKSYNIPSKSKYYKDNY